MTTEQAVAEENQRVKLQKLAMKYFGPNAGYATQYLFHFERKSVSVND
ncbi:MAG: hypothetical protein P1V20_28065 [Verrucomicrobiales bacterium]|nr:hypothetical protein [Verrucomicrobiales bacterium]